MDQIAPSTSNARWRKEHWYGDQAREEDDEENQDPQIAECSGRKGQRGSRRILERGDEVRSHAEGPGQTKHHHLTTSEKGGSTCRPSEGKGRPRESRASGPRAFPPGKPKTFEEEALGSRKVRRRRFRHFRERSATPAIELVPLPKQRSRDQVFPAETRLKPRSLTEE